MIALVAVNMKKFPHELEQLPHGELQFLYSSLIFEAEEAKKIKTRNNAPTPPKIWTPGKR